MGICSSTLGGVPLHSQPHPLPPHSQDDLCSSDWHTPARKNKPPILQSTSTLPSSSPQPSLHLAHPDELPVCRTCDSFNGVLTARQASILEHSLPRTARGQRWCRLYLLSQHGASLSTLLRRSRGVSPTLLCVRTSEGEVIGAFSPSPWWDSHLPLGVHEDLPPLAGPNSDFFGYGGGAFVWSFAPASEDTSADTPYPCTPGFKKSAWSSERSMQLQYLCVEPSKGGGVATAIGMGGGGRSFALLLDETLELGRSGQCETFDSEALTSSPRGSDDRRIEGHERFRATEVEVWGFTIEDSK